MNVSSKNGTLLTHPTFHPPEMGIGSKCVSEDFRELSSSNFQAFLGRGCTSFNPLLSNLDNSPHLTVPIRFQFYLMRSHMHRHKNNECCPSPNLIINILAPSAHHSRILWTFN